MTANDQCLLRCAWQRGPAIARGVVVVLNRQAFDLGLKPLARFQPRIRPRHALRAIFVVSQGAQFFQLS